MAKNRQLSIGIMAVVSFAIVLLRSVAGYAGTIPELITDFQIGHSDEEIAIMNPLSSNSCALIYVFDDAQTQQSCCGCPLSGNGLLDLSVARDLLGLEKKIANGLIEIIPSQTSTSGKCDPTKPPVGSGAVLQAAEYGLFANAFNVSEIFDGPIIGLAGAGSTKTFFANVTVNSTDASKLAAVCNKVQACSCGGGTQN